MENINFDDYIDLLFEKDDLAFEWVYEHTKRGVFSVIIGIVKNRSVTEDLMQDTYTKMLQNLHQYKKGRNFNAWVMQIAKNIAIDYYRKNSRMSIVDPTEQTYLFDSVVEEDNQSSEIELEEYLKVLDDSERQIVLLKIVSELKFKEIAKMVEKPLGTVLWIYQKALKKMKNNLEGGN